MKTAASLLTDTKDKVLIKYSSPFGDAYAYKIGECVYLYHVLSDKVSSISYDEYIFTLVPSLDNYDYTIVLDYDVTTKEILNQIIKKYITESFPI